MKDFEKQSKVTQKEKYLKNLILYKVVKGATKLCFMC